MSLGQLLKEKNLPRIKKKKYSNGIKPSFCGIIDSYLSNRQTFDNFKAEIKRNKVIAFHPSGMYNACPRELAFRYLYEKKLFKNDVVDEEINFVSHSPKLLRLFDTGHVIHMLVQYGYLPNYKISSKAEVSIKDLLEKYFIAGTADLVIKLQNNKEYVVDIKTMRDSIFYKTNTIKDIAMTYLVQLNLYMFGLNIPRGLFYLWNKNTSEHKEIFIKLDREIIKDVLHSAISGKKYLEGKASAKILTECKNTKGKYLHCDYSSFCFKCGNDKLLKYCKVKSNSELFI